MNDNIYAAPKSDVESTVKEHKRPVLVWIIFILACLGVIGMLSQFAMMNSDFPMDEATAKYYSNLTAVDHVLTVLASLYGFVAALQLFRLKKSAFYLYLGQIPIYLVMSLKTFSNPDYRELMESIGANIYYNLLPGIAFGILIAVYAYYLFRKGVLRK
jgi:hypothetical protein